MTTNNHYYAITINTIDFINECNLKSINSVYDFINKNIDADKKIYTISVERNDLNQNIHYHILVSSTDEINKWNKVYWWIKEIDSDIEIIRYNNYIKKDGLYKAYHSLTLQHNLLNNDSWYNQALELIPKYKSLKQLLQEHPHLIKQIHKVEKLWNIINY
jgi:hypothetical protein